MTTTIRKIEKGDFGLATTFWGFLIIIPIIVNLILDYIPLGSFLLITIFILATIYAFIVSFGVINAADKYTGKKIWAILAKIIAILNLIGIVLQLIILPFIAMLAH